MLLIAMLQEAWISIKMNKLRSFLTILGIVVGVCAVVLMVATGQTLKNEINKELESFGGNKLFIISNAIKRGGVRGGVNRLTITYSDYEAITKIKDVREVAPIFDISARVVSNQDNWQTSIIGTTPEYFSINNRELESGVFFNKQDVENGTTYAIIGQTVLKNLFIEGQNPIGETIRIKNVPFTVIGVLKEKGTDINGNDEDDVIITPIFTVKRRLTKNRFPDMIFMIMLTSVSDETLVYVEKRVETLLQERHNLKDYEENDFEIMNLKEISEKISNIGVILSILLASIASISLFVGSIGIMNMMLTSVAERTREIGIRKAIGAKDIDITIQFLFESILISIIGSFIGMILGIAISQIAGMIFEKNVPISIFTILISTIIAIIVGVCSGIMPAIKATKLNPIDALRYQ